ncbi:unnamed protein product [Lactuca virosa]|uniref:RBR-type E3 ubiquitin transferase n=1 Tax=Lactuca virosa TaxID=75947 RepID=A0AAU9M557_9ASTR|nr:unnamed protein product [Lactuca virosa]
MSKHRIPSLDSTNDVKRRQLLVDLSFSSDHRVDSFRLEHPLKSFVLSATSGRVEGKNTDWITGYISTSINDGPGCLTLRCPDPSCGAAIGQEMIVSMVSHDDAEKYQCYFLRSFVEDNRKTKWCPAPGCDYDVDFIVGGGTFDVTYGCSYSFCWNVCFMFFVLHLANLNSAGFVLVHGLIMVKEQVVFMHATVMRQQNKRECMMTHRKEER